MLWAILGILAAAFCCYWKLLKPYKFCSQHGRPVFGDGWRNTTQKESFADLIQRLYAFPGSRYSGMFQMSVPTLLVKDSDLIREITVENSKHFTERVQPGLTGEKWHEVTSTLLQAFTGSKLEAMFVLMSNCSRKFVEHFIKPNVNVNTIELQDSFSRFSNDMIATCAFGVRCDSLAERDNEFYLMGKEATDLSFWKRLRIAFLMSSPKLAKFLGVTLLSKPAKKFFTNIVTNTVRFREATNIVRPDMIHLLMEARKARLGFEEQSDKSELTLTHIAEGALTFFFTGFDSVANLMCFMGYELGINPEIQERLKQEVDGALLECNGKITYDALNNMKYLDMVVAETLRKWPPTPAADKRCVIPYTIQPKNPDEQPVTLARDDAVWLPIFALHRDPKFYPNPDRFDPERFSDENKSKINPYTYVPFGVGARNCIGSRFALLQAKIVYFHLLSKFEIVVVEKTQIPLKLSKEGFNLNAENGFWLGLKKRN